MVTQIGLGANLPEDAIYPLNLGDETGKSLGGANKHVLHFDKSELPPASLLVRYALRLRRLSSSEQHQPLRCQQLDAIQIERGRLA